MKITKECSVYRPFSGRTAVGNLLGIVSNSTISLWEWYFCFAIAALGIDLIWGYSGILSMYQAIFFCLGGYGIAMPLLLKNSTGVPDFMAWNGVETRPYSGNRFTP